MIRFTITCDRGERPYFFEVRIATTKAGMQRMLRKRGHRTDCDAMCAGYTHQVYTSGKWRTTSLCGTIYFHLDSLRMGVITHECVHAALRWHEKVAGGFLRLRGDLRGNANDQEEDLCWVAGNLARQVVNKYAEALKAKAKKKRRS